MYITKWQLIPGSEVWLTAPGTPDRKTKYDLVAVLKDNGTLFNIDSQAPKKVMKEWLITQDYDRVIPEYTYGNSRIDFYMERGEDKYLTFFSCLYVNRESVIF